MRDKEKPRRSAAKVEHVRCLAPLFHTLIREAVTGSPRPPWQEPSELSPVMAERVYLKMRELVAHSKGPAQAVAKLKNREAIRPQSKIGMVPYGLRKAQWPASSSNFRAMASMPHGSRRGQRGMWPARWFGCAIHSPTGW